MRKFKIQSFTVWIGSLLAMAIVCAQLFHFQIIDDTSGAEASATHEESDRPTEEIQISLPSFSLPSPVNIQVSLDSYCLFEILFEEHELKMSSTETPRLPQKLLVTLFRVIISPNAP
jgi:hypothetical protein